MTDAETDTETEKPKGSKLPIILGLVLAVLGGGGGFYATHSGMILAPPVDEVAKPNQPAVSDLSNIAFVELDPITTTVTGGPEKSHIRFRATLEVPAAYKEDVELLRPRIIDVLNSYMGALRPEDLESPAALTALRSQMLRRVMLVTERDRVSDLLVMEFVVN